MTNVTAAPGASEFDLLVVGGGSGGFAAAIAAAEAGRLVGVVNAGPLGGTCTNRGCIPSKGLIRAADVWSRANTGRLLGAQLVGHRSAEISKRVDTYATAIFHAMTVEGLSDLDLSYTPPLGSPWDALQVAAQNWVREYQAFGVSVS